MNNTLPPKIIELFEIYGIPTEEYPLEKYSNRTSEDLRSSIRAISIRLDNLHMDAAIITGVLPLKPGRKFWTLDEINWDDPKLQETDIEENCKELSRKRYELTNVVELRKAITEDNVDWMLARHKAYKWGKEYTVEELQTFFKQNNLPMGFSSLTSVLVKNPDFLEGVVL